MTYLELLVSIWYSILRTIAPLLFAQEQGEFLNNFKFIYHFVTDNSKNKFYSTIQKDKKVN
jgi:hypothetical protein